MSRPSLIWTIIAALFLSALGWVFVVEPMRAQQKWEAARAALIAKGEKLSMKDFPQPKVHDEDNFFADPIWWELSARELANAGGHSFHQPRLPQDKQQIDVFRRSFDEAEIATLQTEFPEMVSLSPGRMQNEEMKTVWSEAAKDPGKLRRVAECTLRLQAPAEPMIARLRELAARPSASFSWQNEESNSINTEHFRALLDIGRWLNFRVKALLELGRYQEAFRDIILIHRLMDFLRQDGCLVYSAYVGTNLGEVFTSLVDQGIRLHAWTEEELRAIDGMLMSMDFPRHLATAARRERAYVLDVLWPSVANGSAHLLPNPSPVPGPMLWFYRIAWIAGDKTLFCELSQKNVECLDAASEKGMNPREMPDRWLEFVKTRQTPAFAEVSKPITRNWCPPKTEMMLNCVKAQTSVHLTRVAIALELYRMEQGENPESLDLVKPAFPDGMPLDFITMRPFRYQRNADGSFSLWSVGWNEKDENGLIARKITEGDWAWRD